MGHIIDLRDTVASRLPGASAQSRTVFVNGVTIAFSVQGAGPPLVLIMGYRLNSSAWPAEFLDALGRRFTIITIDNRGTGKSDKPLEGYGLANLARDVRGVLDHLGIQRAHVLGYSMGGAVAQEFVRQFPSRVAGLVLCATMCGGPRAIYAKLSVLRVMRDLDGLRPDEIARRIWKVTYAPDYLAKHPDKAERQMLREIVDPTPLHAADLQFQAFADFDSSAALPNVRAPALVLTGDLDELIPPGNSEVLAELIPGAELHILPGRGHRVMWEAPETCATIIASFLQQVDEERDTADRNFARLPKGDVRQKQNDGIKPNATQVLADEVRRNWDLATQWPSVLTDVSADLLINVVQPIYFGRKLRLGDGKPVVVVPGYFAGDISYSSFSLWLKSLGYRPMRAGILLNLGDSAIDGPLGESVRRAALRVGRKAVIVAFGTGFRAALRVGTTSRDYLSDIVGLDPATELSHVREGIRVHILTSGNVAVANGGAVHRVKSWPWPIATNPDALLKLSDILREIGIELLDRDEQNAKLGTAG